MTSSRDIRRTVTVKALARAIDRGRYESFLRLGREQEHLEAKTDRFKQQEKKARDKALAKAVRDVLRKKGRE